MPHLQETIEDSYCDSWVFIFILIMSSLFQPLLICCYPYIIHDSGDDVLCNVHYSSTKPLSYRLLFLLSLYMTAIFLIIG